MGAGTQRYWLHRLHSATTIIHPPPITVCGYSLQERICINWLCLNINHGDKGSIGSCTEYRRPPHIYLPERGSPSTLCNPRLTVDLQWRHEARVDRRSWLLSCCRHNSCCSPKYIAVPFVVLPKTLSSTLLGLSPKLDDSAPPKVLQPA